MADPPAQWITGRPGDTGDGAFCLRRADGQGRPVVLEFHLGLHAAHAVARVHVYDTPADHATADLAGCAIRCSLPGRELYEAWLLAGRDNEVVAAALADLEVPDAEPPLPASAQRTIDDLAAQVKRLQGLIDAAGLQVQVPGELLTRAAEQRARKGRRP